jgi:hypothetical protein
MSEKFCIFCGEKPKDKNLEHVIPQWLIRLTGRERSDVFSLAGPEYKHLPFLQFKFPACTKCNTKYAKMEAAVKPVVEKVLDGQSISGQEASLLMDWFDKVRIGLWLSNMFYDPKLKQDVRPHFFIDSRVGASDRMLSIQKIDFPKDQNRGIYFGGTQTPLFDYEPSAFTLIINDYYFFNASTHNLVAPRLGFPKLTNVKLEDPLTGGFSANVMRGREKITNPVITSFIPNQNSVTFYQPIYKDLVKIPDYPLSQYVHEHSYDASSGLGGVFVQRGNNGNTKYLKPDDKVGINIKPNRVPEMIEDVLDFQQKIHSKAILENTETKIGSKINEFVLNSIKSNHK